jgi:hypothetical protein
VLFTVNVFIVFELIGSYMFRLLIVVYPVDKVKNVLRIVEIYTFPKPPTVDVNVVVDMKPAVW